MFKVNYKVLFIVLLLAGVGILVNAGIEIGDGSDCDDGLVLSSVNNVWRCVNVSVNTTLFCMSGGNCSLSSLTVNNLTVTSYANFTIVSWSVNGSGTFGDNVTAPNFNGNWNGSSAYLLLTDQRYNDTLLINANNVSMKAYADTKAAVGNCPTGYVVMNTTTSGVQCVLSTNLDGYAKYSFGYNNFNGNGNFTTTSKVILLNDNPDYTYFDMSKSSAKAYYLDGATETDIKTDPATFISESIDSEADRISLGTNDTLRTHQLCEYEWCGYMLKISLPSDYPINYYTSLFVEALGEYTDSSTPHYYFTLHIWNSTNLGWQKMSECYGTGVIDGVCSGTITTNLIKYIDANNTIYLLVTGNESHSGDKYWNLNYIAAALKNNQTLIYSNGSNGYWSGNLVVAGDIIPEGSFIPTDVIPSKDGNYSLGTSTKRWASIIGLDINAYTRLNVGKNAAGMTATTPLLNIILDSLDTNYNSYISYNKITQSNPSNINALRTAYEQVYDNNDWTWMSDPWTYTVWDRNFYISSSSKSPYYGGEYIINKISSFWNILNKTTFATDPPYLFTQKLQEISFTMRSGDETGVNPELYNLVGTYYKGVYTIGDYGFTNVSDFGWYSLMDNAFGTQKKLYWGVAYDNLNKVNKPYLTHDGTNFIINATGAGALNVYNASGWGTVGAKAFVVHTSVYDKTKGAALSNIKDASALLNPDGSINHTASPCYTQTEATDFKRPVNVSVKRDVWEKIQLGQKASVKAKELFIRACDVNMVCNDYKNYSEVPISWTITHAYQMVSKNVSEETFPYKVLEDGVDMECMNNLNMQSAVELLNKSLLMDDKYNKLERAFNKTKDCVRTSIDWRAYQTCVAGVI